MDFRCGRREALDGMEGMVKMIVYLITGISILMLVGGIVWSIYMAVWGVYDEFY